MVADRESSIQYKGIVYFGAVKHTVDTPAPEGANIFIYRQ